MIIPTTPLHPHKDSSGNGGVRLLVLLASIGAGLTLMAATGNT